MALADNSSRPGMPAKQFGYIATALSGGAQDVLNASITDPNKVTPLKSFAYEYQGQMLTFFKGMSRVVDANLATALRALTGYVS